MSVMTFVFLKPKTRNTIWLREGNVVTAFVALGFERVSQSSFYISSFIPFPMSVLTQVAYGTARREHTYKHAFLHLPWKTHLDLHILVLLASMQRLKFFSSFRERNLTYNIVLVQVVQHSDLIHVYIVT